MAHFQKPLAEPKVSSAKQRLSWAFQPWKFWKFCHSCPQEPPSRAQKPWRIVVFFAILVICQKWKFFAKNFQKPPKMAILTTLKSALSNPCTPFRPLSIFVRSNLYLPSACAAMSHRKDATLQYHLQLILQPILHRFLAGLKYGARGRSFVAGCAWFWRNFGAEFETFSQNLDYLTSFWDPFWRTKCQNRARPVAKLRPSRYYLKSRQSRQEKTKISWRWHPWRHQPQHGCKKWHFWSFYQKPKVPKLASNGQGSSGKQKIPMYKASRNSRSFAHRNFLFWPSGVLLKGLFLFLRSTNLSLTA